MSNVDATGVRGSQWEGHVRILEREEIINDRDAGWEA